MSFDITAVHNKSDLIQYVTMAGGKPERDNAKRYSCACPLHGGENESAFSIYFDNGIWKWHCFTGDCGTGDSISFVMKWQNLKFPQACEWILGEQIVDIESLKVSAEERLRQAIQDEEAARLKKEARVRELQVTEKHLQYHNACKNYQWARDMWITAGLDEGLQDFFYLGAREDFTYYEHEKEYHSPTLTIPYFNEQYNPIFINHRLVNPHDPKRKYRPEMSGLDVPEFLAVPPMGYDGELVIVVEGAKKSMVTWSKAPTGTQVIGVSTQGTYYRLEEKLKGKKVIVIPDPDKVTEKNKKVLAQSGNLARAVNGRVLRLPYKIDDYIVEMKMSENQLYSLLKQARIE